MFLTWLEIFLIAVILLFIFSKIHEFITIGNHKPRVIPAAKKDFKRDVVYLYRFPNLTTMPNASPYCVKVEFFLRYYSIPYESITTAIGSGAETKKPFIELNGRQICDSDLIIYELSRHFDVKEKLTKEQWATSYAVSRVADKSTFSLNLYNKVTKNAVLGFTKEICGTYYPSFVPYLLSPIIYYKMWKELKSSGIGYHRQEEIVDKMEKDLEVFSLTLGDKKFLTDEKNAGYGDFSVFGHLVCAYNLPVEMPLRSLIDQRYPNLRRYMETLAKEYFSDYPFLHFDRK